MTSQTTNDNCILNVLDSEGRQFCTALFESYSSHIDFLDGLSTATAGVTDVYITGNHFEQDHFVKILEKTREAAEKFTFLKKELTMKLIISIEEYLSDKYNITFDSYAQTLSVPTIPILNEVFPVIKHITDQCGKYLYQCGKKQIVERLKQACDDPQRTVEWNGFNIIFSHFFAKSSDSSGETVALSRDDRNMKYLLDAINLHFYDENKQRVQYTELYKEWKANLRFGKYYHAEPGISFKLTKNGNLKLRFPTRREAEHFVKNFGLNNYSADKRPVIQQPFKL